MPECPVKPCAKPGCGELTTERHCKAHKPQHSWGTNKKRGTAAKRGYGWKWQKIRKVVLARDNHLCQECLKHGRTQPGNHVDHITPKAQGGTDAYYNLQCLCQPCHEAKTAREKSKPGD